MDKRAGAEKRNTKARLTAKQKSLDYLDALNLKANRYQLEKSKLQL
ncbi:MAG: hypothetical protein ACKODM_15265 [Cytophagales bacterium]